ncbi:MAG: isochorismate synthase [Candidatus Eisenbacteria bacterium]|nr:isochorismate synthase [Candidatus Eisenbacteria bacterium]
MPNPGPGRRLRVSDAKEQIGRPLSSLVSRSRRIDRAPAALDLFHDGWRRGEPAFFWGHPAGKLWIAGVGTVAAAAPAGPGSLTAASGAHREWMRGAVVEAPRVPGVGPVAFGAFRFDMSGAAVSPWDAGRPNLLVLPRLVLSRTGPDAWLTVNASAAEAGPSSLLLDTAIAETAEIPPAPVEMPEVTALDEPQREEWLRSVERALERIAGQEVHKTTLARRAVLRFADTLPPAALIRRLLGEYPDCRSFAVGIGRRCFLGASPELLIGQSRGAVTSLCLAGSAGRGADAAADAAARRELLEDRKERWEHELVVRWITERLGEHVADLEWNRTPRFRILPSVQHLETVFRGRSRGGANLLRLVDAIHPTPAVAGKPLDVALPILGEEEDFDRGWYGGPVGWVDRAGEGEMALGIRSALLDGSEAHLFAGAGIVEGSRPEKEWEELRMKFQPLLQALAVPEAVGAAGGKPERS